MNAGIELLIERQTARRSRRISGEAVPGLGRGTVPLPRPDASGKARRPLKIIRRSAGSSTAPCRDAVRRDRLLGLLEQAEDEVSHGIFASPVHDALENALAGEEFMPARLDRLRLRRWRAIAYRKTRLLRDLFQTGPVPERVVAACWDEVEAFPEFRHYLVDMLEGSQMNLSYRPCDQAHLALTWVESEIRATGRVKKPSPFGVSAPQSPAQWRTCLMVPAGLDVPLGQVCLFQGEAFVFMEIGDRHYQLRANETFRYGWHLAPSGAKCGVYLLGRLAEDHELSHAQRAGATCCLDTRLGEAGSYPFLGAPQFALTS
jgi:hypothetical protein